MNDNGTNGTMPEFDFSDLSWGEAQRLEALQAQTQNMKDAAGIQAAYDGLMVFLSRIIVSIPDEWVIRSRRGESIDWSQPESVRECLRNDKTQALVVAMGEALKPENASKN